MEKADNFRCQHQTPCNLPSDTAVSTIWENGPEVALRGRREKPQDPDKLALTSGQASGSSIGITRSLLEIDFPLSCWIPQFWDVAQEADFFFLTSQDNQWLNIVDSRIGEKDKEKS